MIVYVESNFVLELTLRQEEATDADELLGLAEAGIARLVYPVIALREPLWEVASRARDRITVCAALGKEVAALRRTSAYDDMAASIQTVVESMLEVEKQERASLEQTIDRIVRVGECAPLDKGTLEHWQALNQSRLLSAEDAMIYASIVAHIRQEPVGERKCFVTRDKEFLDVEEDLRQLGCQVLVHFRDAVRIARRFGV